jgi:hypothetical protein
MRILSFLFFSFLILTSNCTKWNKNDFTDISGKKITAETPFNSQESGECLLRSKPLKECHQVHKGNHKAVYECLKAASENLDFKFADRRCAEHYSKIFKPIEENNIENSKSLNTPNTKETNTKIIKDKDFIKCLQSSVIFSKCTNILPDESLEIQKDCISKAIKDSSNIPLKDMKCFQENLFRINELNNETPIKNEPLPPPPPPTEE